MGKIEAAQGTIVYQANTLFMLEAIRQGAKGIMAIVSAAGAGSVLDFWRAASQGSAHAEKLHRELVYLDALLRFGYPPRRKCWPLFKACPWDRQ